MNLGKLFNFKYLKQNLKKSKGILTILILIIPVITTLILIGTNSNTYLNIIEPLSLSIANIVGMYVIPVLISYILYGYVYKKKSVDFIGSMPLTRSTIFATNFLGGILIIAVIQALTVLATFLSSLVLANINIAFAMILDVFVVMFLSYSFVFSIATLAMTISGNFLTQIVVTMIITFLIPFMSLFGFVATNSNMILKTQNDTINATAKVNITYTLPSILLEEIIYGNSEFYVASRNIKTLILTVVYFAVGIYLFNKRKMENNATSFNKLWVHMLVKSITILPMIFILMISGAENIYFAISLVIIFIYYLIYDFVTSKKVPIKYTIPTYIVAVICLIGLYEGISFCGQQALTDIITEDDIKQISFCIIDSSSSSIYVNTRNNDCEIYTNDQNKIKEICSKMVNLEKYYSYDYVETPDVPVATSEVLTETPEVPTNRRNLSFVELKIKLKNGKESHSSVAFYSEDIKQIISDLFATKGIKENLKEYYTIKDNAFVACDDIYLDKEKAKELINIYNSENEKDKFDYIEKKLLNNITSYYGNDDYVRAIIYKNHEIVRIPFDPLQSEKIFDKIEEIRKERLNSELEDIGIDDYAINFSIEDMVSNGTDIDSNYEYFSYNKPFIKYIKEHANEDVKLTDDFYICRMNKYGSKGNFDIKFFLKKTDELVQLINIHGDDNSEYYK